MKNKIRINKIAITPRLIGPVKDHKDNVLLRPIVTKCVGTTYSIDRKKNKGINQKWYLDYKYEE